jgi:hypothetical protein
LASIHAPRVQVGAPDETVTGLAGILAVRGLVSRLGVIDTLDNYVGGIKQRDRGLSAGQFLVALVQAHMQGIRFFSDLDRLRTDGVAQRLPAASMPASTTALSLVRVVRRLFTRTADDRSSASFRFLVPARSSLVEVLRWNVAPFFVPR